MIDFSIKPKNTYNLDEIGFLMGYAKNAKIIKIIQKPRVNGKLFRDQGILDMLRSEAETIPEQAKVHNRGGGEDEDEATRRLNRGVGL